MNQFGGIYSQYYDLLYEDKDYKNEVDYVSKRLGHDGVLKNLTLLDLGCGTGIHTREFSKRGLTCMGIDISEGMIEVAALQSEDLDSATYKVGDISDYHLSKNFNYIVSLFHVFSYLTSQEQVEGFFKSSSIHMQKDAILLFDYWNMDAVKIDPPIKREKNVENNNIKVNRQAIPRIDIDTNIVEINFNIEIYEKAVSKNHTFKEKHLMRFYSQSEIDFVATKYGFELIKHTKWLSDDAPSSDDWYACSSYRKK